MTQEEPARAETPPSGGEKTDEDGDVENVEEVFPIPADGLNPDGDPITLTWKTWLVIFILSAAFGLSFWPIPTTSSIQARLGAHFGGDQSLVGWYVPAYTTASSLGLLIAGTNSDLFGRRIVLVAGNAICCIGFIVSATARSSEPFIAGLGITGFGAGFCQMAMCAIPELMPNKYRHIGICVADGLVFIVVVIGPVYAIDAGERNWQFVFWGGFVAQFCSLVALFCFYFPPKHPRGVPWKEGLKGLDYVGTLLVIPGICLALVGIINTTYKPASSATVVAPMASGFGLLVVFALWETFSNVKYPLCPPHIFRTNNGREFTVPFILAFIVTMFYYGINIIYPTMINVFYVTPDTPRSEELVLTLPGNLGLVFGACLLTGLGNLIGHWKWSLVVSWIGMTLFGGLLALVTPANKGLMIAMTFLMQTCYGWAQYESIAFTQLGVSQTELGIAGGLAGVARFGGGSLAQAIFTSLLANTQSERAAETMPHAAIAAGLDPKYADGIVAAFTAGADALADIPGLTPDVMAALTNAFKWSYAHGLKMCALVSLAFAGIGLICCLLLENIDAKMNNKTEIFLENDIHAEKNKYH
ncbi:hypothetical protein AJ80_05959 [Polytolypa hystricis UAMH7299]|uniref:Major facilitator superfamily (MFS) profile domain-containing protein n=1 Tax=Polytolypa hystricis (strain UAMH7299) TaxID=1447883 RepID=A0A2B7XZN0_POLH7|nr:hypothetical protein AJ80_05959 [Polytolypa hystricis UAMH7299]